MELLADAPVGDRGLVPAQPRRAGATGASPACSARLVDNPGALAGLTARRIFRLLPRLAWKQDGP